MEFTREVILHCFKGKGTARIEVITRKAGSERRSVIAVLYSPTIIDDQGGLKIKVYGDGRVRKIKKGFRIMEEREETKRREEDSHG